MARRSIIVSDISGREIRDPRQPSAHVARPADVARESVSASRLSA